VTRRRHRLDVRLFVSYTAVATICAVTFAVVFHLASRDALRAHLAAMNHDGVDGTGLAQDAQAALQRSFNSALPVALFAGLAISGLVAAFVSRRILQPITNVRFAARRLADGHFDERVSLPPEIELAGLADDLNHLAANLQTVEQRRVALLADVGHELRTPLTTIEGVAQGLIDNVFEPTIETYELLLTEVARLRRLADDLKTISRVEEQAEVIHTIDTDIAELTRSIADGVRPQFDSKQIQLTVHGATTIPGAVDPDRFRQILGNVLVNALVHTPVDGHVDITSYSTPAGIRVAVTDSGIGLSSEDTVRVFERFYRVPGVTRSPSGSGIGLSIARRFARAHGGDLTCTSTGLDHGSTFTIELPHSLHASWMNYRA
jgi:signal transduction histidine kinase